MKVLLPCLGTPWPLGALPPASVTEGIGLPTMAKSPERPALDSGNNPFSSILPLLMSLPTGGEPKDKTDPKPSRYLTAKGLPTLPMKTVEKVWSGEYVDMEEFLPAPRSLRLAEQGKSASTLQESLVGALNQFQATQGQRGQHRVMDIITWVRCFTLYIAVMAKKSAEMIPCMVAHLHTVLRLHQKAANKLAWLEYDIQFRMEIAASEDRSWTCGDPWQYVSCLPGPSLMSDPFDVAEWDERQTQGCVQDLQQQTGSGQAVSDANAFTGKGKRPLDLGSSKGGASVRLPAKKPRKSGICRLLNSAPGGCPYGRECIFTHRCSNCGAMNEHGRLSCPHPPRALRDERPL